EACARESRPGGRGGRPGSAMRTGSRPPDGLVARTRKTGVAGQAAITLKGKGGLVPTLSLPLAQSPAVTVQLQRRAGPCWETVLSAPADPSDGSRWKDAVP